MSNDPKRLAELEELARAVGDAVGAVCDEHGAGFALLMFDFGEGGWVTYLSNGERESTVEALRECANRIESGTTADAGTGGRLPS